ncbi:hypothetical protein Bhyg_07356 [Pseudolycoriella hygida]|uniref:Uncharacterized protein n=1 Tax=Pseudolycoriella hygida TaxID=35572 RepID=A0A9Q0N2H2_9DIPT|nr:hypothetical protein Bhyg_07356 [Pseudolycoriella hygida]
MGITQPKSIVLVDLLAAGTLLKCAKKQRYPVHKKSKDCGGYGLKDFQLINILPAMSKIVLLKFLDIREGFERSTGNKYKTTTINIGANESASVHDDYDTNCLIISNSDVEHKRRKSSVNLRMVSFLSLNLSFNDHLSTKKYFPYSLTIYRLDVERIVLL